MINEKNIEKTKILIKKTDKPILIKAQDDVYNRKILEYGRFDFLVGVEQGERRNTLRNIDSGFNHILAEICKKNNIGIGIDIAQLVLMDKKRKGEIISKISQNIKICNKYNVKLRLFGFKDKKDSFAFLLSLGASTAQAKQAISF